MDRVKPIRKVDTDKAWQTVHQRLQDDGLIPEKAETFRMASHSKWIMYAATLMVLMAVGSIGYYWFGWASSTRLITLQTGFDNSTFVQTFDDGSVVYMANNSSLFYPETFIGGERKVSLTGEAFFDVFHKAYQPFVIETSNAIIEVLGTAFNLKSSDEDFELIVEEGSVRVTLKAFPENVEVVGQWERLTGADGKMEKSPVIDRTYLSWRTNRMQFKDEKLGNIVSVISRNYDISINFENDFYRENRMSVTFDNNDINTIARVIAFMQDLEYEIVPGSGILFSEKK